MKRIIQGLVVLSAALLVGCSTRSNTSSTDSSSSSSDKSGDLTVLKVATPGTLFPTSYHNDETGELTGYEIDMMNEIGKRLDVKIEYTEVGVAEAFTALDSGQADISVNNFDTTKERQKKYNLSVPYKYSVGGMIVREDDSSDISAKDLSDWTGKKAGGGAGTGYMKIAEKQGAEPVIYDNVTNDVYLRDVSTGRTDFIPNNYFTQRIAVKAITSQYPDIKVKVSDVQYNPTEQVMVMRKSDKALKQKIDKVIKEMKEDGTLKKISEKYYDGQDLSKPLENVDDLPVVETE